MANKILLTAHQLAEVLDLSVDTIWRYTREKRIPHIEVGPRQYRYQQNDVLQALNKNDRGLIKEEEADYAVKPQLTYEDYAKIPNEVGYTIQLIDGLIVREPSPTFLHQRVSRRLLRILEDYFNELDPGGEVFVAPLDLRLDAHTVVQPDLLYLPSTRPASSDPVDSLPDIIIEILSPSTARTDRLRKLRCYQIAGIPHYWLVDPDGRFIECFRLQAESYHRRVALDEGNFSHPDFPGLTFDLKDLWAEP